MLWVKLMTHISDHPRFVDLGAEARDLWTWGMVYAGKHETDGEIPTAAVLSSAWGAGGKANAKAAERLVAAGLWEKTATGFRVLQWAEQGNQTKESIAEKRRVGRERKARFEAEKKSRNAVTPAVSNAKGSTSTSTSSEYVSGSLASPRVVGPDGDSGQLFGAWSEGIREATGIPQSGLSPGDRRELVAIANTHAAGATGQALLDWARSTAIAFAKAHDPTYGGFVPLQARKWLDGGRRERTTNGAPRQPIGSAASAPWMNPTSNFDFGASK